MIKNGYPDDAHHYKRLTTILIANKYNYDWMNNVGDKQPLLTKGMSQGRIRHL